MTSAYLISAFHSNVCLMNTFSSKGYNRLQVIDLEQVRAYFRSPFSATCCKRTRGQVDLSTVYHQNSCFKRRCTSYQHKAGKYYLVCNFKGISLILISIRPNILQFQNIALNFLMLNVVLSFKENVSKSHFRSSSTFAHLCLSYLQVIPCRRCAECRSGRIMECLP